MCALTAGPGVTNGMSAIASAAQNNSPVLVLGGRAPHFRWGQGSLQEIDHVPFVRPLVKLAATPETTAEIPGLTDEAMRIALTPRSGPTFVDFPLDHVFMEGPVSEDPPAPLPEPWRGDGADASVLGRAAALLRDADRPVIMAGTGLYWGRGEQQLLALAEELGIPVFLNGLARGCVPADHELFFSRSRSKGLGEADVALVIGVPLDFRLGFGAAMAPDAEIIVLDTAEPERDHPRRVSAELYGALPATLDGLRAAASGFDAGERERWVASLRATEMEKRAGEAAEFADDRAPLHPMRVSAELAAVLDRDAIIIVGDGDFVSYAGRVVNWSTRVLARSRALRLPRVRPRMRPPAVLARPDRQVVLLLGDGAFASPGWTLTPWPVTASTSSA